MSSMSLLMVERKPSAYLRGIKDARSNQPRNLDAYPYDMIAQCAYEYGWADYKERTDLQPWEFR